MRRLSSEETALLASMPPLPVATTAVVAAAAGRPRWTTGRAQAERPQTAHRSQTDGHDGQPPRIATTDGHDRRQATSTSVVAAGPHRCEAPAIAARLQSRRELAARLPPPPPLRRRLIVNKSSASDAPAAAAQEESYLVSSLGRTLVAPPRLTPRPSDSLSPFAQPAASAMRRLSSEETALLAASAGVPTPVGDISLVFPLPPTPPPRILRHCVTSPCDGLTTAASDERTDRAENAAASHPAAAALPVPLPPPPPNLQPHPARRPSLLSRLMRPLSLARPPAPGLTSPSLVARRRRTARRLSLEPSSPARSRARRFRVLSRSFHHSATVASGLPVID